MERMRIKNLFALPVVLHDPACGGRKMTKSKTTQASSDLQLHFALVSILYTNIIQSFLYISMNSLKLGNTKISLLSITFILFFLNLSIFLFYRTGFLFLGSP